MARCTTIRHRPRLLRWLFLVTYLGTTLLAYAIFIPSAKKTTALSEREVNILMEKVELLSPHNTVWTADIYVLVLPASPRVPSPVTIAYDSGPISNNSEGPVLLSHPWYLSG